MVCSRWLAEHVVDQQPAFRLHHDFNDYTRISSPNDYEHNRHWSDIFGGYVEALRGGGGGVYRPVCTLPISGRIVVLRMGIEPTVQCVYEPAESYVLALIMTSAQWYVAATSQPTPLPSHNRFPNKPLAGHVESQMKRSQYI